MGVRIGKISGGIGSWAACKRDIERRGSAGLRLLFTDTLCEDQDAYRFLIAGAFNIYGRRSPNWLPAIEDFPEWMDRGAYKRFVLDLRDRATEALPQLVWLSDGRDPWDVFEDERFLGNSRVDPCSKILKRKAADRWLRENCAPADTTILVGIDYEEAERFDDGKGGGIRARTAAQGWRCEAPLCESPYLSWSDRRRQVREDGLWVPRLYEIGFAHNNCGGFCCKGGHGHFALMLRAFPERYAYAEWREQKIRGELGDVTMLTDRRGGSGKKPLTLTMLRERIEAGDPRYVNATDMGACGCFFGDAPSPTPQNERRPRWVIPTTPLRSSA